MHKVSAVIITLNEERNIERVLTSLKGVADEVIVYDSFSTDRTKDICQRFDVRFIQDNWKGYSATKNLANQLATHDYVLSIDADEAVSEPLKKSIQIVKEKGFTGVYSMNRITNYCGKWIKYSGWYPDKKIRVFPKNLVYWEGEWVHETLFIPEGITISHLEGDLEHYSYYNYKEHREKADHYSRLTAKKMYERGKKVTFLSPYLSGIGRFVSMYLFKFGFLDGYKGFKIAQISAASNVFKYKELIKLYKKNG